MFTTHRPSVAAAAMIILFLPGRTAFAGCEGREPMAPCYSTLRAEVYQLDRIIPSYEMLLDNLLECGANGRIPPKDIFQRLVKLDSAVAHVGAEVIMKERPPWEIQAEIDCIKRELRSLRAELLACLIS